MKADQVTPPVAHHGEGPVWDERRDRLLWVDLLRGDVLTTRPDGNQIGRHHVGHVAACLRPRSGGGYVVAVQRRFVLTDPDLTVTAALPEIWSDAGVRMNDGACDSRGRFYAGTMAYDESPGAGRLFRLDPDLTCHEVRGDLTISNGLGWSPDGTTAYHVDTPTGRIDALEFDPDSGTFGASRPFAVIDDGAGFPDGLTVDAEGGVWVALWDGGAVRRYGAGGDLDAVIELPVRRPTACTFGGADLRDLYITTSAIEQEGDPQAGSLFHVRPGVIGSSSARFAA